MLKRRRTALASAPAHPCDRYCGNCHDGVPGGPDKCGQCHELSQWKAAPAAQPVSEPFAWIWPSGYIDAGLPCGTSEHDKAVRLLCRALTLAPHFTPTADGWTTQAEPVAAQKVGARQFWAVIAPCGEGVLFDHKKDARWTHTGQGTGSDGFGVPTIGGAFRDIYAEENLELVRVQVIDADCAPEDKQSKGGAV